MSQTSLGTIEISPQVLERISAISVSEIPGVHSLASSINQGLSTYLRTLDNPVRGVYLYEEDGRLSLSVYCYLNFGYQAQDVAREIQRKVKARVHEMTEVILQDVNVYIVDFILDEDAEGLI